MVRKQAQYSKNQMVTKQGLKCRFYYASMVAKKQEFELN